MKDGFASLNPPLLFEFIYVALTSGFSLRLENEANSGFSPEPREGKVETGLKPVSTMIILHLHISAMNGGVKATLGISLRPDML